MIGVQTLICGDNYKRKTRNGKIMYINRLVIDKNMRSKDRSHDSNFCRQKLHNFKERDKKVHPPQFEEESALQNNVINDRHTVELMTNPAHFKCHSDNGTYK